MQAQHRKPHRAAMLALLVILQLLAAASAQAPGVQRPGASAAAAFPGDLPASAATTPVRRTADTTTATTATAAAATPVRRAGATTTTAATTTSAATPVRRAGATTTTATAAAAAFPGDLPASAATTPVRRTADTTTATTATAAAATPVRRAGATTTTAATTTSAATPVRRAGATTTTATAAAATTPVRRAGATTTTTTTTASTAAATTRVRRPAATAAVAGAAAGAGAAVAAASVRRPGAATTTTAAPAKQQQQHDSCQGMYRARGNPLLYGGTGEKDRCLKNCQPRDDFWGKTCAFSSKSGWGVCNAQQARNAYNTVGRFLGGGEAARMTPCDLLPYLRGRTLWLLGDSHSKSMYKALQCFLIDFWNHGECETNTDAAAVQQLFNLPERNGFQKCLHLMGPGGGRICIVEVVLGTSFVGNSKIPYGGVMPLLRQKFAQKQDIFYVNFGVWHKKRPAWWATLEPSLEALGRDFQENRADFPHLLFRETPAEHPKNNNGQTCLPMRGYLYSPKSDSLVVDEASRISVKGWNSGMSANTAAKEILGRYNIPIVSTFAQSVPLHDNHIGTTMNPEQDCLHYCMPGVPQFWVYSLFDAMRSGKAGIQPIPSTRLAQESSSRNGQYTCIPNKIKF